MCSQADCYLDINSFALYILIIDYTDSSQDGHTYQNIAGWHAQTVTVTAPNNGKSIKALRLQAEVGSGANVTRKFAFDKADSDSALLAHRSSLANPCKHTDST